MEYEFTNLQVPQKLRNMDLQVNEGFIMLSSDIMR